MYGDSINGVAHSWQRQPGSNWNGLKASDFPDSMNGFLLNSVVMSLHSMS